MRYIFQLTLILLCAYTQLCNSQNITEPEINVTPLYKNNIGKIAFMPKDIALSDFKEDDFLKEFTPSKKNELYLRAFLPNSLTNYLHELAPKLAINELNEVGNFQFTFYIDGLKVYIENLHHGAFGIDNKNMRLTFKIPLTTTKKVDSWGWFMWKRFLANGGENALTNGTHQLILEIRPYVLNPTEIYGDVIAKGELKLIINKKEKKIDKKLIEIQSIAASSDFEISNKTFDKELIKKLNEKITKNQFKEITSIVVLENNKLLIEEYFNGAKRKTLHDPRSATKSVISTIVGIAIKDGHIKSINQRLGEFYDLKKYKNYSPLKDSITIKDLLTMSSGLDGNDFDENSIGNEEKMYSQKNWVSWALDLPMTKNIKPGEKWAYFTAGCVILGDLLNAVVPNGLEDYCKQKLFSPLGIKNYKWQYTPQKVVNTAGGLKMSAVDFAKFGQLYKNQGNYNSTQIVDRDWVNQSFTNYFNNVYAKENYGFLFWNKSYKANQMDYETFFCSGNGGNKIFVMKNFPVVIVITAKAFNTNYMHKQIDEILENYLLPAIRN